MRTLYDFYQEFVVELDPILWEAGRVNGIHVNNEARLQLVEEMSGLIRNERDAAQQYVPESLFPLKHYKSLPETDRPIREIKVPNDKVKTCSHCGAQHVTKTEHTGRKGGRDNFPLNSCYKAPIILTPGVDTEYDIVLAFNPGSDDQLKEYAELYRHRLGRNWKTGEATLDAKHVQKLINKYGDAHPIYRNALQIRKIRKARGYAKAWVPNEYELLFGEFKHVPETFRLSQANHNFMNVSHRGDVPYAHELRKLLVAPPGYLLVEGDSSSIEAVFSGFLMGSKSYMELAKRGIHAWWALQKLGLPVTPENLKWVKNAPEHQILYETKKRTVHGVSYGMGAKLLHESYPEYFPVTIVNGKRCENCSAQAEIDEFYTLVPELAQWHNDIRKKAHKQGYLQSRWGFRNYYYRVYSYDWKKQQYVMGEDAKAVVAFEPQHSNAMFQRENLKLIHQAIDKLGKKGKWFMTAISHVHDSNGMRVPEDDLEKASNILMEVMNRPVKQMNNIQIGVAVKYGKTWGDMINYKSI